MNWRARAVRERIETSRPPADPAPRRAGPPADAGRRGPSPRRAAPATPGTQNRGRPRRRVARLALAPTAWAAWRLARSAHWGEVLRERRTTHSHYWQSLAERNADAGTELLYVAIGDSTAQGIGARAPAGSYVGQLERRLQRPLRVVNLSISGARLSDLIAAVLPRLAELDLTDALVTLAAGANNIDSFDPRRFRAELSILLDALPTHALVAELPSFYFPPRQARVRQANAILHDLADERDLTVVPLFNATNRRGPAAIATHHAADLFHPNDRGYRLWAEAFLGPAAARIQQIDASASGTATTDDPRHFTT